jgi:nucleoside-diphosphate-sugar epimerase
VLVTGAGGFMGRHLVADQLARGRSVTALDLDVTTLEPLAGPALRCLKGDVADPATIRAALEGVDVVFHLAAAHLSVAVDRGEYRRTNVGGVAGLITASADLSVRRFVHCSTVGVYGALREQPADEGTPCHPQFDYEVTKLAAERLLLDAFAASGFPVVILRPVWVYGPGCPRTDKLFGAIARRRFVVAGRGDTLRHSIYIRDMCRAFDSAASAPGVEGEVIIVGDAGATTVRNLVDEIAALVGAPAARSVPAWILYAAGLAAEAAFTPLGREPPLSRRTLRFFSGNTSFRTDKARGLLDSAPRYTIREGLAETHRLREAGRFWSVPLPPAEGSP